MGEFSDRVYEIVQCIPRGKVATYGQIARLIGSPRAARYVGYSLHANPRPGTDPDCIPCHRVVFKDGSLCDEEIFAGLARQEDLLKHEDVTFIHDAHGIPIVDMKIHQWDA
ncbi:MAG: MGMT family protein [Actinomycetaceae bacterium]|nr:MGMT family protein [Actinomycetaceae bacterium]